MSDSRKEAEEKMAKAIFISADCWLCVFDLLPPRQLGLGIALINHRFDYYVDEHFKTRKWALSALIQIESKMGENGTKEMDIFNCDEKPMPIPEKPLPTKIVRFEGISIRYIDQNVLTFLHRFRQLFAKCPINLAIDTTNDRILDFILRNIWPMIVKNIHGMELSSQSFHRLRQLVPSILNDCPSLHVLTNHVINFFIEFPADHNAAASDGQAVAKWLFIPLQNDVPKVFKCELDRDTDEDNLALNIEAFRAAFANASSSVNFIVLFWFYSYFDDSVVPFDLTNELTREQLTLKGTSDGQLFLLIRCPIARDESKWTKWEEEAIGWQFPYQWNTIDIYMDDEREIGEWLHNRIPGPSDQQQNFISADCWLCVFDLLPPSQLGLGIAMISHRFDFYVDEHFKTRKWALSAFIQIRSKMGENGTKEMEIVNCRWKSMQIPKIQMPHKVIGFEWIKISFIDRNAIAFLCRFFQFFAACKINLSINTFNDRILDCILRNIWPLLGKNFHSMRLSSNTFRCLRQFVPSILNDYPSLRIVSFYSDEFFTEFPADDSAAASDGQAVAKWLFTPLQNNVPKMFKCLLYMHAGVWPSNIEPVKAAFANASFPANFIVVIWFRYVDDFVVPFDRTNELIREQLVLKRTSEGHHFLLVRCPIARDESKWTKWEKEAVDWQFFDQWNKIDIHIDNEDNIGDGLLEAMPGPSDQQQK
ncbi:hypothetical protein niasHT_005613 [Heterodera trifolii]|uniref:Uncharacterized protein n=1 Tax=Heterodera trifolii TaxID=157864 RepID=A0ABD2M938_9BILA